MIAWPVAITASAVIDSIGSTTAKTNSVNSSFDINVGIDDIIPIRELSDKKYDTIKQSYEDNIRTNEKIDLMIAFVNQKLRSVNCLLSLIGFISLIKRALHKKANNLEEKIKKLTLAKKAQVIEICEIIHQKGLDKIVISRNDNVYLVFSPVNNYFYADDVYVIERKDKAFFQFSVPSILTLNFEAFQVLFYDSVLIITTENDFAIISYSHITADIQQIHLFEKRLDSNISYSEVKETWLHACLDGTPDLRYKFNSRVYDVQYWNLSIKLYDSFYISILFSAEHIAKEVYNLVTR